MLTKSIELASEGALEIVHNVAGAETPVSSVDQALAFGNELSIEVRDQL